MPSSREPGLFNSPDAIPERSGGSQARRAANLQFQPGLLPPGNAALRLCTIIRRLRLADRGCPALSLIDRFLYFCSNSHLPEQNFMPILPLLLSLLGSDRSSSPLQAAADHCWSSGHSSAARISGEQGTVVFLPPLSSCSPVCSCVALAEQLQPVGSLSAWLRSQPILLPISMASFELTASPGRLEDRAGPGRLQGRPARLRCARFHRSAPLLSRSHRRSPPAGLARAAATSHALKYAPTICWRRAFASPTSRLVCLGTAIEIQLDRSSLHATSPLIQQTCQACIVWARSVPFH